MDFVLLNSRNHHSKLKGNMHFDHLIHDKSHQNVNNRIEMKKFSIFKIIDGEKNKTETK